MTGLEVGVLAAVGACEPQAWLLLIQQFPAITDEMIIATKTPGGPGQHPDLAWSAGFHSAETMSPHPTQVLPAASCNAPAAGPDQPRDLVGSPGHLRLEAHPLGRCASPLDLVLPAGASGPDLRSN